MREIKTLILIILLPISFYSQKTYRINQEKIKSGTLNDIKKNITKYDTLIIEKFDKPTTLLSFSINNFSCHTLIFDGVNTESVLWLENLNIEYLSINSSKLNMLYLGSSNIKKISCQYVQCDKVMIDNLFKPCEFYYSGNGYTSPMNLSIYGSKFYRLGLGSAEFSRIEIVNNEFITPKNNSEYQSIPNWGVKFWRIKSDFFNFHNNKTFCGVKYTKDKSYETINFEMSECSFSNCYISKNLNKKFTSKNQPIDLLTSYNITDCQFEKLQFSQDTIDYILLQSCSINKDINIENNCYIKYLSLGSKNEKTSLPEFGISTNYKTINNKIITADSIYSYTESGLFYSNYITANSYKGITDEVLYKSHLSNLMRFNTVYREQGNKSDANLAYNELKKIETLYLKEKYIETNDFNIYSNYQLNRFLQIFSDYGTNPIKSVSVSFWIIIIFATLYFFTYSDWDKINSAFFINKSNKLIYYFTSEQKLEDFYTEAFKEELNSFKNFKETLYNKKGELPFFFILLMRPLYIISVIKFKINTWIYRRVEILKGRWIDLKKWKKITIGTTVFIWSISYLIYLATIRSLNSLMLSINTFSTLGFGDIPVKGISRYIAIIEGFLGWFLLSIFSVSLISQVLQN